MRPRCFEIDDRAERYRELAKHVSDALAGEAIDRRIAKGVAEKPDLHPEPMV
jgi:hypothetical protein